MVIRSFIIFVLVGCYAPLSYGQASPPRTTDANQTQSTLDLREYGVRIEPDQRLIVMMAALDAAGFDPTPAGKQVSPFRAIVRKDNSSLDPALRERMKIFFDKSKLPPPATAADQAARYV